MVLKPNDQFRLGDALLLVDLQNDFFPGGALGVPEGDKIIPIINRWISAALMKGIPIIASRDWHPHNHISFKAQGGPWPPHCIQNTKGAEFHPRVKLPSHIPILNKASHPHIEAYSAFEGITDEGTSLTQLLEEKKVNRLWIGGLALDYCVRASALDAKKAGLEVHVDLKATRGIAPETSKKTIKELTEAGVTIEK